MASRRLLPAVHTTWMTVCILVIVLPLTGDHRTGTDLRQRPTRSVSGHSAHPQADSLHDPRIASLRRGERPGWHLVEHAEVADLLLQDLFAVAPALMACGLLDTVEVLVFAEDRLLEEFLAWTTRDAGRELD